MSVSPYLLREFDPETDHDLVNGWRKAHQYPEISPELLPKLGILACVPFDPFTEHAAAWLDMSNSTGVAYLNWITARPGNTPAETFSAVGACVHFLKQEAKRLGYGVIIGHCSEKVGRAAQRHLGFEIVETGLSMVMLET